MSARKVRVALFTSVMVGLASFASYVMYETMNSESALLSASGDSSNDKRTGPFPQTMANPITVRYSGFRFDRIRNEFVQAITITAPLDSYLPNELRIAVTNVPEQSVLMQSGEVRESKFGKRDYVLNHTVGPRQRSSVFVLRVKADSGRLLGHRVLVADSRQQLEELMRMESGK